MTGLLLKEIFTLKKQLKMYALIIVFYGILSFFLENPTFIYAMTVILLAILPVSTFSFDNYCKWDLYQLSLPLSRFQCVAAKYLFALIPMSCGAVLAIAYSLLLSALNLSSIPFYPDLAATAYISIAIGILLISIMMPLLYRFGPERSRIMLFVIMGIPAILVVLSAKLLKEHSLPAAFHPTGEQILLAFKLSPFLLLIVLAISFLSSLHIYKIKEL